MSDSVGGVADRDLAAVVGLLPALPNIGAEPADRFAQAVRALVENRAQREWPNEGDEDLAVFIMVDHPRPVGERHGGRPFADLIAKSEPLLGRLFFANRDASSGRVIVLPTEPNAIVEWLEEKGLGDCSIVTVYRGIPRRRRWSRGAPVQATPLRRIQFATLSRLRPLSNSRRRWATSTEHVCLHLSARRRGCGSVIGHGNMFRDRIRRNAFSQGWSCFLTRGFTASLGRSLKTRRELGVLTYGC